MSNPTELLQAATYALKTEKDPERAKKLAQDIVYSHPYSKEAESARLIVSTVDADAAKTAKDASDDAYSAKDWDEAKSKSAAPAPKFTSKYGVARGLASLIEILGWLIVIGSIVLGFNVPARELAGVVVFFAVAGMVLVGLFVIMGAQIVRATVDNADHTGEMLAIMKSDR